MELSRPSASAPAIVPQPPPAGLYVTLGPDWLITWALEILTKTVACPSRLIWVDGANAFNAYYVAIAARTAGKDATAVLQSYYVARPFTAYQMETMISEKTLPIAKRVGALITVLADPLRLFADAEGRDTQIEQCYKRFLAGLRGMARETAVLVLAPIPHNPREMSYSGSLLSAASRITQLEMVNGQPALALV